MTGSPDFLAYEMKIAAAGALRNDVLPLNKAALFEALEAAGIRTVVVCFDGCGDSGQIESVEAFTADNAALDLPATRIEMREVLFDGPAVSVEQRTVREVVEIMTYDLLEQTHDGWEDGDGAEAEFRFDVADRSILLDYDERYTATKNYQHEF